MSHSSSRRAHKGGTSPSDPDRRVKYVLRYARKGDDVEVKSQIVRRARKKTSSKEGTSETKDDRREDLRRERRETRRTLAKKPPEEI